MPKLKKSKGNPEDLLKQIDEEIKSGKLTDEEIRAISELKKIIEASIENGSFKTKEITFKTVLLEICKIISAFALSFLFILVMFGLTNYFLATLEYYPILIASLSVALGYILVGRTDILRCAYDKFYLGTKLVLGILKLFTFALLNLLVFKIYDSTIILIISVIIADSLTSFVVRRIFK